MFLFQVYLTGGGPWGRGVGAHRSAALSIARSRSRNGIRAYEAIFEHFDAQSLRDSNDARRDRKIIYDNQLFIQQDEVVPFYVSFTEFKGIQETSLTLRQFAEYYLQTLVTQYLAFHLNDAMLIHRAPGMHELLDILREHRGDVPVADLVERYLDRYVEATGAQYQSQLPAIIQFTRRVLGVAGRTPGILIVDEFQVLTELLNEETGGGLT